MREPPGPVWGRAASCCLWPHGCSGRRRARPPARLGGLTSFGAAPRSPPVPSGPSGALHSGGAWHVDVSCTPPLPTGAAARPKSCGLPMALHDRQHARLKPPSPLLVRACVGLKPPPPLRARNERFWCSFRVQRCRWFQWLLFGGEHWCCGFQSPASECTVRDFFALLGQECARARKSSPSMLQRAKNRRLMACWASFFAEMPMVGVCRGATVGRDPEGSRPVLHALCIASGQYQELPASCMGAPCDYRASRACGAGGYCPRCARTSLTPAEDSGRRRRARPPQPRRRSSGRRPWRPREPRTAVAGPGPANRPGPR